jgi:fibronectin-binding autotransporter adhesin
MLSANHFKGTGGIIKEGAAILILTGNNSYQGTTLINNGTLALTGPGSIASSNAVNLASATSRFDISGGSGNKAINNLSGVAGSQINLGANNLSINQLLNANYAGTIQGSAGIIKEGTGTLTLTGINTYLGSTFINSGGIILDGDGSIANSSAVSLTSAGSSFAIAANSGNKMVNNLSGVAGSEVNLGVNTSLTVNQSLNLAYSGSIAGSGVLIKQESGILSLNGFNQVTP